MVDSRVIEAARLVLQEGPRRILVTGGTGFIGGRVARLLSRAGNDVTIVGRNPFRSPHQPHSLLRFEKCDLLDSTRFEALCRDRQSVIHCAADSAAWGPQTQFVRANVDATQNVVDVCLKLGIRMVHVSSTAIHFEHRDRWNVSEADPLPRRFACGYAWSKAVAEQRVQNGVAAGLNGIILRARAVFGEGDNQLFPRILRAAQAKRLPRIGDGKNVVDFTYVDNLAYAICLGLVRGVPGTICTITNGEPVPLWPTLAEIIARLELPPIRRRIPYALAYSLASTSEAIHRLAGVSREPTLTTYGAGLLAKSQTFTIDSARKHLGYQPLVSFREGLDQTIRHWMAKDEGQAQVHCKVEFFTTGYTPQPYSLIERGRSWKKIPIHAMVALITHPTQGRLLFDVGYAKHMIQATQPFPYSLYGRITPVVTSDALSIRSQLADRAIAASDIRAVVLSHFHADHVAGLKDFPESSFIASHRAWHAIKGRRGLRALKRGFIPTLLPDDFEERLYLIDAFHDAGFGPFAKTHDLFGDGSLRLIDLSGHASGQIGMLIQVDADRRVLLAADATWTLASLRRCEMPNPMTYGVVDSIAEMRANLVRLHGLQRAFPEIEIVPTHCPEVAEKYRFQTVIEARSGEPSRSFARSGS